MSDPISNLYRVQFANTQSLLLQQLNSRFDGKVMTGSHKGKQASVVDQYGPAVAKKRTGRYAPKTNMETATDRRWVTPEAYDSIRFVDSLDKLKTILDPQSPLMLNINAAIRRAKDDEVINAFFSDVAKTGEEGNGVNSWTSFVAANTGHKIAVTVGAAAAVPLNVAKLRAAKKALMKAEVDIEAEELFAVIGADDHDALLAEAQVVSTDFNDKPVLVDGRVQRFMGFNFIHSERLLLDGSSYRRVPIYAKSGMHLGIFEDVQTGITVRDDLEGDPIQLTGTGIFGATRTEEKKIVEVLCG